MCGPSDEADVEGVHARQARRHRRATVGAPDECAEPSGPRPRVALEAAQSNNTQNAYHSLRPALKGAS